MSSSMLNKNQWLYPHDSVLPWQTDLVEDQRFKRFLRHAVGIFLAIAILMPFFSVPEKVAVPIIKEREQYTRLIIEKKIIPTPKIIEPTPIVVKKPKPLKKEKLKVKKPKVKAKPVDLMKQARDKAAATGMLAFADDLSAMRESIDVSELKRSNLTRGTAQAEKTERKLLVDEAQSKVGGIDNAVLTKNTGGIALSARESTLITAPTQVGVMGNGQAATSDVVDNSARSAESIRRVMDANKGGIFSIYNRALRSDPSLSGKVQFRMVVEPSGAISHIELLSNELLNQALVTKILSRIKLINFGADSVESTDINYSFDFLPY